MQYTSGNRMAEGAPSRHPSHPIPSDSTGELVELLACARGIGWEYRSSQILIIIIRDAKKRACLDFVFSLLL